MARNHTRAVRPRAIPVEEIEAFHSFFELHQRGVFSLLVHLGLDESQAAALTQEVFVSVWNEWRGLRDEDERVVACYRNALVRGRAAAAGPRTSIAADDGPVAQAR